MHRTINFFGEIKMKKGKKLKVGKLIISLFFILLYFSIQFGGMGLRINDEFIRDKKITPVLSAGKSVSLKWNRTWGGEGGDGGEGVAVDSLDNVYISGYTFSFGAGYADMVLVKCDENGVQQWYRTWGGDDYDYGNGVAVDSLDNVYITGRTESFGVVGCDMVLVKYDENGLQQWNRTWGGNKDDIGYGVAMDSSGNIYLAGTTSSLGAGSDDMVLVKYDENGEQQWNQTWGGGLWDRGYGVAADLLDNVYLTGYTYSYGEGSADMILVKYDSNGVQRWNRTWGGAGHDEGSGVTVDSSSNIYLAGHTNSFGAGIYDMVLVKYDSNGMQQWNRTWGGVNDEGCEGVAVDSTDDVYLTGTRYNLEEGGSDIVLVKYDSSGVQQWSRTWGGDEDECGNGVAVDLSGNVYVAGSTLSFGAGSTDMVLVKYSYTERPPFDEFIMILITAVSIASAVGVGIAITYFIRKRRKIAE
jgi:uncharacterized delta-60 repeat protein